MVLEDGLERLRRAQTRKEERAARDSLVAGLFNNMALDDVTRFFLKAGHGWISPASEAMRTLADRINAQAERPYAAVLRWPRASNEELGGVLYESGMGTHDRAQLYFGEAREFTFDTTDQRVSLEIDRAVMRMGGLGWEPAYEAEFGAEQFSEYHRDSYHETTAHRFVSPDAEEAVFFFGKEGVKRAFGGTDVFPQAMEAANNLHRFEK